MDTASYDQQVDEIIRLMKRKEADSEQCLEFLLSLHRSPVENFDAVRDLTTIRRFREELSFCKCYTMLHIYLSNVSDEFRERNPSYINAVRFIEIQDLLEVCLFEEAKNECNRIVEWSEQVPCPPAEALAYSILCCICLDQEQPHDAFQHYTHAFHSLIVKCGNGVYLGDGFVIERQLALKAYLNISEHAIFSSNFLEADSILHVALNYSQTLGMEWCYHVFSYLLQNANISVEQSFQVNPDRYEQVAMNMKKAIIENEDFEMSKMLRSVSRTNASVMLRIMRGSERYRRLLQNLDRFPELGNSNLAATSAIIGYTLQLTRQMSYKSYLHKAIRVMNTIDTNQINDTTTALNVVIAECSIGACYTAVKCYEMAESHLKVALEVGNKHMPNHAVMARANELMARNYWFWRENRHKAKDFCIKAIVWYTENAESHEKVPLLRVFLNRACEYN